ncbi:hypothetical protein P691DRAFT_804451 [Macrolepiota fuliginosa MF-IS2]|uniref:Nephrocystin 3-like N-terminal domain-containing protein n=1 Tax=Macrolepiota fuliginosa MF-IS2 TaxID=1400762 RepID=A0A9P5X7X4_9AGAR|nr:hypothetical protein P691DRAFT_804451 [Macrolepiota fuliginosa MF-IS2]
MHNPTLYDVTQNFHYGIGNNALQLLASNSMKGAEFDSSERDPPPRCHPGTRYGIIETCQAWRKSTNPTERMLWLNGAAGVGKSAIMQTMVELEHKSEPNPVGATLFFSKLNARDKPNRVIPTLAYRLAVKNASYLNYVAEQLSRDPKFVEKTMAEQFRCLIRIPFGEMQIWKGPSCFPVSVKQWPTEYQFLQIARASSGHFGFATTVIRFIGGESAYGDPISQLLSILAVVNKTELIKAYDEQMPLAALDVLYTEIMNSVPSSILPITKLLLGCAMLRRPNEPLIIVANLLGLEQNAVYHALQRLHSILGMFHVSFSDYLSDPKRSNQYFIDPEEVDIALFRGCSRILREYVGTDSAPASYDNVTWSWPGVSLLSYYVSTIGITWLEHLYSLSKSPGSLAVQTISEFLNEVQYNRIEHLLQFWIYIIDFFIWMRYYCPTDIQDRFLGTEMELDVTLLKRIRVDQPTSYVHLMCSPSPPLDLKRWNWHTHKHFTPSAEFKKQWGMDGYPELLPQGTEPSKEQLVLELSALCLKSKVRILKDSWAIVEAGQEYQSRGKRIRPLVFFPLEPSGD